MPDEISAMTFEKAFAELEQIVSKLEDGRLALEESLALYERGQALAGLCSRKLDEAELTIEQMTPQGDRSLDLDG